MALRTGGGLETISLVVTVRQASELRQIRQERSSDSRRVSVSDIAREALDIGIAHLRCDEDTDSSSTVCSEKGRAAA